MITVKIKYDLSKFLLICVLFCGSVYELFINGRIQENTSIFDIVLDILMLLFLGYLIVIYLVDARKNKTKSKTKNVE